MRYLLTLDWNDGRNLTIYLSYQRTTNPRKKALWSVIDRCKRIDCLTQGRVRQSRINTERRKVKVDRRPRNYQHVSALTKEKFIISERTVVGVTGGGGGGVPAAGTGAGTGTAAGAGGGETNEPVAPKQPEYYKAKEPDPNEVSPLEKPTDGSKWTLFTWGLVYPIHFMCRATMPDCRQEKFRNWYPFTFCVSMVWISFYSYIMVWMITIIGKRRITIRLPASMRLFFLPFLQRSFPFYQHMYWFVRR